MDLRRLRRRGGRPLLRPGPAAGRARRRSRCGRRGRGLGDARRVRELRAHVRALRLRGGSCRRPLRSLRPAPDDGHRRRRVGRGLASACGAPVRRNRGRRRSRGRALPLARAASASRLARRSRGPRHDPVRSRRPAPGRPFRAERGAAGAPRDLDARRDISSRTRSAASAAAPAGLSSSSSRSRPGGSRSSSAGGRSSSPGASSPSRGPRFSRLSSAPAARPTSRRATSSSRCRSSPPSSEWPSHAFPGGRCPLSASPSWPPSRPRGSTTLVRSPTRPHWAVSAPWPSPRPGCSKTSGRTTSSTRTRRSSSPGFRRPGRRAACHGRRCSRSSRRSTVSITRQETSTSLCRPARSDPSGRAPFLEARTSGHGSSCGNAGRSPIVRRYYTRSSARLVHGRGQLLARSRLRSQGWFELNQAVICESLSKLGSRCGTE